MQSIAHGDLCVNRSPVPPKNEGICVHASPLAAANALLLARRVARRAALKSAENEPTQPTEAAHAPPLPAHLGWGSAMLAAAFRPKTEDIIEHPFSAENDTINQHHREPANEQTPSAKTLRVHPTLLTTILKNEQVTPGRIWLLCRHLDQVGRGWLSIDELRKQLTGKDSKLRVCGWRRLRQILQQGQAVFWQRDTKNRLWLRSTTKVAAALDIGRFSGAPIVLPLSDLLQSIGHVRAAFYASFHAGREARPISRKTLAEITGASERVQRQYDQRTQLVRVANYSLTSQAESAENVYWQSGRAAFQFIDKFGRHGAVGRTYWAVRLPNSYQTSYSQLPSSGTKQLNRQLKLDLVLNGTQGNTLSQWPQRLFHTNGKKAVRAYNSRQDVYIQTEKQNRASFWSAWLHD